MANQADDQQQIIGFEEKPSQPKTIPGDDQHALASMGIYIFSAPFLFNQLCSDATLKQSAHDFGHNIIPSIIDTQLPKLSRQAMNVSTLF